MHAWCEKGIDIHQKARDYIANLDHLRVKKVLVIRHAALGDMILTRPFLIELKKLFPNAHITIDLVSQYQLAAPLDLVDDSHITYGQDMRNQGILKKFKNLNEHGKYDLIFDLASTSRSRWVTRLTKADLKLGFPFRKMGSLYDVSFLRSDFKFEAETLLDFLCLFGAKVEYPLNFKLPIFEKSTSKKRIAYFMGASIKEKCYPTESFTRIIELMAKKYPDYDHCILEGAKKDEKYDHLKTKYKNSENIKVISLMKMDDLLLWLSQTSLLVSNDTGVRNLAIATHTPTYGIFFEAIPYRYIPRYEHIHEAILCTPRVIADPEDVFKEIQLFLNKLG